MNQAARNLIACEARRAVAADRQQHRIGYRRTMVNPITLDEHMQCFTGDVDAAFAQFARAEPDVADLDGARALFEHIYANNTH